MRHAVLDRPRRQAVIRPTLDQRLDMFCPERSGVHVDETRILQLAGDAREHTQPVGLGRMTAVAVLQAELPQFISRIVHDPSSSKILRPVSSHTTVSVFAIPPEAGSQQGGGKVLGIAFLPI
jgi:hypothetical protein